MKKITRSKGGLLAGAAGLATSVSKFLAWVEAEMRPRVRPKLSDEEDFYGILVMPSGDVHFYDNTLNSFMMSGEYFALGSGGDIALGAMACGAGAVDAVHAAIKHKHGCAGPIQILDLGDTD